MEYKECRTYYGRLDEKKGLEMPDGKSFFKLYYLSLVGRDTPEAFEWDFQKEEMEKLEKRILESGWEGVGFITAFPHIIKVFRYSPVAETVLDVRSYNTKDFSDLSQDRADGSWEFCCYAESVISAEEYEAWAKAETVEEYLPFLGSAKAFDVIKNEKLRRYWEA